ncbi:MAG TPA: hypothetical protein VMA34_20315 [Terracidiphilus sp.]|nr:hypothetical protein [Terracidiphilus sp.]
MKSKTVLGHLVHRIGVQQENVATEALGFILANSSAASRAFTEFICQIGFSCPGDLRFETQRGGLEDCIPDMKCYDAQGRLRVTVESKFWAELTKNQPVTYLREFQGGWPAALLFVVPEARLPWVWKEVLRRCAENDISVEDVQSIPAMNSARIGGEHFMAMTSWRALLDALYSEVPLPGEIDCRNDMTQLRGLCDMMDQEPILPLKENEIGDQQMALRIVNFNDLAHAIVDQATGTQSYTRSHLKYGSGAYLDIANYRAWVGFDALAWHRKGISPIWVAFLSRAQMDEIREKLTPFRRGSPRRCFESQNGRVVMVPIFLKTEVEKYQIIQNAVDQIHELAKLLGGVEQPATVVAASSTSDAGMNGEDVAID